MKKNIASNPLTKKFPDAAGLAIPKGEALKKAILSLKKEKKAFILADVNQPEDILELSDIKNITAENVPEFHAENTGFIIVCSTQEIAEKIKKTFPQQRILMPDKKHVADMQTLYLCLMYEAPEISE